MKKIPQKEIYELLSKFSGTIGLYIENITTGETFKINPDKVFPCASVIKIPMLGLLLKDVNEGKLIWQKPYKIADNNRVAGTGILSQLESTYDPTLASMALLMITLSDNTATNEIMDMIGIDRMNDFYKQMGYKYISLQRKMLDFVAIKQGRNNYMCAGEAGDIVAKIAKRDFISHDISQTIEEMMSKQQCRNKLPALLPAVESYASNEEKSHVPEGKVLVANKTGDLYDKQHDIGIFTLPSGGRYVISAFTGDLPCEQEGIGLIAKLSCIVYDALK